jgi:hypothetical protein
MNKFLVFLYWIWGKICGLDGKSVAFGFMVGAISTAILIMKVGC